MLRASAVVFVVLAGFGAAVRAADGDLDPGFADAGRFVLAPADVSLGVGAAVTQADGRLLLAGGRWDTRAEPYASEVVLWRLDGSGRLDPTFGSEGEARRDPASPYAQATGLALARNGDLLVSAVAGSRPAAGPMRRSAPAAMPNSTSRRSATPRLPRWRWPRTAPAA